MGRYDWPADVEPRDDPMARGDYNARYLPPPDVRPEDGSLPPLPPSAAALPRKRPSGRAIEAPPNTGPGLWLPLGPSTLVGGQATGRPKVSGRVRDLAVEPTDGDRVYAATGSGGVWFSGDRGVSWKPLDEFVESPGKSTLFPIGNALACGAIHVVWGSAADGSLDEVIVGTGEPGGTGIVPGTPGGAMVGIGFLTATGPATGVGWTRPASTDVLRGAIVWRITGDPLNKEQLFAATSLGLFVRDPSTKVWSATATSGQLIDVVVTRSTAPDRVRIWYARAGQVHVIEINSPPAPPGALNVSSPSATSRQVPLAGFGADSRIVLAARGDSEMWVLGTGTHGRDERAKAHLERIDATLDLNALAGTAITGVPENLFASASDQSWYDMTLAVHPDQADLLYAGGATTEISDVYNATIYRLQIAGTAATPTQIGDGVHADVHIIRVGPRRPTPSTDRSVWVGCDGGVFLSDGDGRPQTFGNRNNALSTLQPGFVACHPTNDGIVAAGMQDNGTCDRVGDTVWREPFEGDGGGVVFDPAPDSTHPSRYWRQYTNATWASSDHEGTSPVFRILSAHAGTEDAASLFYSGAAALSLGGNTHLALGTNRPWYSSDWGQTWMTVPTGTDPRSSIFPDLNQDVLTPVAAPSTACCTPTFDRTHGVITCRLSKIADGDKRVRLLVLWSAGLAIFVGSPPTSSAGSWTWTRDVVEQVRAAAAGAETTAMNNGDPVPFLPGNNVVNDIAVHDPSRSPHGSCYVATTGDTGVDTVWWYDGTGKFLPCGVRRNLPARGTWSGTQITSPALSVVVDPADASIVYVGTSVGVVRGVLAFNAGGDPTWTWAVFDNGLPEGAVHDLSIYQHEDIKLLRAAVQARGVWETDLNNVFAQARTYLRVYPSDSRRRRPTPLSGPPTFGETNLRYDASPDIIVDATAVVWPSSGPGEGDLFDARFAGTVGQHAAQAVSTRSFRVHVMVHHRWMTAATPAQVKVALLRHTLAADGGEVALGTIWATLVAVAGGATAPTPLPDGWELVDTTLTKPISAAVEPRLPRAVTFDANLSALAAGSRVLLLAVVMSDDDPIDAAELTKPDNSTLTTVSELVLHSRHAAARSIQFV